MAKAGITKGGNKSGNKWNKGGSYSRKKFSIDYSAFSDYAEMLDNLGADLKEIFDDAMGQAAETVQDDVRAAMAANNLPAKGQYSQGDTEGSIISDPKVEWSGNVGEIGLGFDKTKSGAGGFLITGTPYMRPDYALEKIFVNKKYQNTIVKDITQSLQDEIDSRQGG